MSRVGRFARTLAVLGAGAAGAYGAYAVAAWYRYGRPAAPGPAGSGTLLDSLLPAYEVADRQSIRVAAPAALALAAGGDVDLDAIPIVRAIFAARARLLGAAGNAPLAPAGLIAQLRSLGWGVLAEVPERAIVLGAVTRPWEADVVFRSVPAAEFAAFAEPGYVKILVALAAEPLGSGASLLLTETRVATTDAQARVRFRTYWAAFSAGIRLIRVFLLRAARREAERRAGTKAPG
jgi:hypothetical protein